MEGGFIGPKRDISGLREATQIVLVIQELEGSKPIRIELRRGAGVEQGAAWESELRGSVYTPIGARAGVSTVTGVTWGTTEMTLHLEGAFFRSGDVEVDGAVQPESIADIQQLFERLQQRGRECAVALGDYQRRGVLRGIKSTPGRRTTVQLSGQPGDVDLNRELTLKWEWTGLNEGALEPQMSTSGGELAGQLGGVDAKLGKALASALDITAPDFLTGIRAGIGRLRAGVSNLRSKLRSVGSILQTEAKLVNEALSAAQGLGNIISDFQMLLSDTDDAAKAIGPAAEGVGASVTKGDRMFLSPADTVRSKTAASDAQKATDAAAEAVANVLDAFERLRPAQTRRVPVHRGQSLADVAREHLGDADRWTEIASRNGLIGQVVPAGVTQLELLAR